MREAAHARSKGWLDRLIARWMVRQLEAQAADPNLAPDLRPILASEVATQEFTRTRFRDGYDAAEVDEVLDRMAALLEAHERDQAPSD